MIQVANRACVRRVAVRSLKASQKRNLIALLAILLTTLLFTALFTIAISINDSFQQSNFLMVGGDDHGSFKDLTREQLEKLKKDPLIRMADARWFLGAGTGEAFRKAQVEVSYMDVQAVKHYFCKPEHGHLPKEGTDEAMTDTRVLKLLGVTPKVGTRFQMTIQIGSGTRNPKTVTKNFILSGWWDYNEAALASHVVLPESAVKETLREIHGDTETSEGQWTLGVMFSNARHIEKNLQKVITDSGFQYKDASKADYIGYGVNWGYTGAQSANNMDATSMAVIVFVLLVIGFTGYLIIYNVFQISVTQDIRFYGLLKTIGMTGRQIKRIIRMQGLLLAGIGIPAGLLCGFGVGAVLVPEVMAQMSYGTAVLRLHGWVFAGATLFSLVTVMISCSKPGRIASKVSPVEAVRYAEVDHIRKKARKTQKPASLLRMAWANVGRKKKKLLLVVISLTLAVVLMNLTVMFANGFDMNRYLGKFCSSDFQFANADYFNVQKGFRSEDTAVEKSVLQTVLSQEGIKESGCVYGQTGVIQEKVRKKDILAYNDAMGYGMTKEEEKLYFDGTERASDGSLYDDVQAYGMDAWPLSRLTVIKGDISRLIQKDTIAAVYSQDDYDHAIAHSNWAKVGDKVTLRYVDSFKYYDKKSGKEIPAEKVDSYEKAFVTKADHYTEKTYTVAAEVIVPSSISYRYYGAPEFVMGSNTFIQDSGTDNVMHVMFDMKNEKAARAMERYLKRYTQQEEPIYGFKSKYSYEKEFDAFRGMFLILGGVLSGVIAVVGILNYFNAIMMGILARRREFAVLQSVGMTKKQLRRMLIYEGLLYTLAAGILSIAFAGMTEPLVGDLFEKMFWFFRFRYTIWPVLSATVFFALIGALVPCIIYHFAGRLTIVDRLRQAE